MSIKVIAEIGTNFTGVGLVEAGRQAAQAGADVVKLQLFRADRLYRIPEYRDRLRPFEVPLDELPALRQAIWPKQLWASVFDIDSLVRASPYLDAIKIASGDLVYEPLVLAAADIAAHRGIPIILSTGAALHEEVERAIRWVRSHRLKPWVMLCVSAYPARWEQYPYRYLWDLRARADVEEVGFSDHTPTLRAAMFALLAGATFFEKHFRPSGPRPSPTPPDWGAWAIPPASFGRYAHALRALDAQVGPPTKRIDPEEARERIWARRGPDGLRPKEAA